MTFVKTIRICLSCAKQSLIRLGLFASAFAHATKRTLGWLTWLAFAPVLFAIVGAGSARATAFGTNDTDVWWVSSESGWGMTQMQQGNAVFATLYLYDQNGSPTWYTATLEYVGNGTYAGDLYATTGSWFGAQFVPSAVTLRKVGTLQTVSIHIDLQELTYSVDGVVVTKRIQRQTLRYECFCGNYVGAFEVTKSQCATPFAAGDAEAIGTFSITQKAPQFAMTFHDTAKGTSCTYSGSYSQQGHFGDVRATYTCSDGETGSAVLFEMDVSGSGFTGRIESSSQTCASIKGHFGGVRRLTANPTR
jgi:hypothetical protein